MIKKIKNWMKIYKILIKMTIKINLLNLKIKKLIIMKINNNYNIFITEITIHLKTYY